MKDEKVVLVHGGAWAVPEGEKKPHVNGVRKAAQAGWDILSRGGSALDAVAGAVRLMEADSTFNAGRGSVLNQMGEVELDAAIMHGETLSAGAVASVKGIEHPVDLARKVMDRSPHVLLVGDGAASFANVQGIPCCAPSDLIVPRERERWEKALRRTCEQQAGAPALFGTPGDTVGAVARDEEGHLAAATSTGGCLLKLPGRVGDSPLVGCGLYADDQMGAACATGWGEGIIRVALAHRAVDLIAATGKASDAARAAIDILDSRAEGRGGIILVSPNGEIGFHFNTPCMSHAYFKQGMTEPEVGI